MVSAVAGQIISFVGQVATSYLLSRINAPDGPRIENLDASSGEYGVPMPKLFGEAVRITGPFVLQDDIEEEEHKVEDYSEIAGVIGGAATGFSIGAKIGAIGGPAGAAIGAVAGGLLGFAAPDQKYYTYSCHFAIHLADRFGDDPIEGVSKIWANGKKIFDASQASLHSEHLDGDGKLIRRKYLKNKYFKSLAIYGGHTDQFVDPIMEEEEQEVSAHPFEAYAVFEKLQLAPFGNSLPQSIDVLVEVKTGQTLAAVAEIICAAANIDPTRELSSTALISDVVRGYAVTQSSTCWDALKPLLPVFGVDAAEVSGQIRFYRRSQSMQATVPVSDMGAHIYGDSPPDKLMFKRGADLQLPKETSVTFLDPERDYQPNTATSSRVEGDARSNVSVNLPLVLEANEGANVAAMMHWDSWLGRTQVSFVLPGQWTGIEPGRAYAIPFADSILPYRVTRKIVGANGLVEVEALSDESVSYSASLAASSGAPIPDDDTNFPDTRLILMDMPIIADAHDEYGYYIAMSGGAGWTRGRIEVSDNGTDFVRIIDQPFSAVMGDVTGTLAAGSTTGLDDTLDTTTVLTVETLHSGMTFESATDAQLDAWANFGFVGKEGLGEYLQWKTATQVGPTTWELTDLRRGRRGTDHAIGTHTSGEEFADLTNGDGVYRIVYSDTSEWGNEFTYRGVTLHQDSEDADEQTFTNTGEGKRPFSPVNVEGSWDGSNNLDITWDSRSRLFAGGLGIDDNAEWDIEITNATPVRSDTVVAETFAYSAADQTTDGLTPGTVVEGRVRQTSDVNDGRWREFVLYGPLASTADSTLITADTTLLTADMA